MNLYCGRPESSQIPSDPSNVVSFYAIGISGGIRVVMRMPPTNPEAVAYTILYSAAVNQFDSAIEIAKVRGEEYYDWFEMPTKRYYWIEQVSINGTHEERLGPVSATSIDPSLLTIEHISKRIHEGLLATSLREEIDRIDILATSISKEALLRASELGTLTQIIRDVQESYGDNIARFNERLTVLATDQESIVENVQTLLAEFMGEDGPVTAAIQEVSFVFASETLALSERSTQLESVFEDKDGNIEWAALQQQLSKTKVDKINNTIENSWMVKLQSQRPGLPPLIGGFGMVNDGLNVEAGFDVDTFWVGRANGAQIYPFIIDGSNIFFNGRVAFSNITGPDKPEAGATRNENLGSWSASTLYTKGDVVSFGGNSWVAKHDHTSTTGNRPPVNSTDLSSTWLLNAAKGDKGEKGDKGDQGPQGSQGLPGSSGSDGSSGAATTTVYKRATSVTTPPAGTSNPPSGWYSSVPNDSDLPVWECVGNHPGNGQWVWQPPSVSATFWTKPNSTYIDGSKIFTGEAYVDTLEIKGRAITIHEYAETYETQLLTHVPEDGPWETFISKAIVHPGYNQGAVGVIIIVNFAAVGHGHTDIDCRVVRSGWEPTRTKFSVTSNMTNSYVAYFFDPDPPVDPTYRVQFRVNDITGSDSGTIWHTKAVFMSGKR